MTFISAADAPPARLWRRLRIAGVMLVWAGAQAAWADDAPAVQLGGTVMHADATRSLALMAVGPAGWQLYRAGVSLTAGWAIEAVHFDEVVLRAADGRRSVVAMGAAHASTAVPGAARALPVSPERAAALRSLPSADSIQAAQKEFELPAND